MGSKFRWLLASTASGSLADGIATAALPLLLISLTTDPLLVALLPVASGLPWLMFSLHAGVLVDRLDRRSILWIADASRAVLAGTLVVLVILGAASVVTLLVVAFLEGVATVLFRAASPAMLPTLVAREELARANGQLQTGAVAGGFLGPALGGILYPLAAIAPFATQTASMIGSALCLRRLPARPATQQRLESRTVAADIREGLRAVTGDRVIRSLAVTTCLLAASTGMLQAVLVLHVVDALGAPKAAYGVLFSVFAAGYITGAPLTPRLRNRIGSRGCLLVAAGLGAVGLLIIACAANVYLAGIGMALLGLGSMIYNIVAVTVRQERIPTHLLGRVSSTFNLLSVGALPAAALAAGAVAAAFGTTPALLVAAATCGGGLAWLVLAMGPIPATDIASDPDEMPHHSDTYGRQGR